MPTLEIVDPGGVVGTIDFVGGTDYKARLDSIRGLGDMIDADALGDPAEREISFNILVSASSVANLVLGPRSIDRTLATAESRYKNITGTNPLVLKANIGTTNGNDVKFTIKRGFVRWPPSVLRTQRIDLFKILDAQVVLFCEPLGEYDVTTITASDTLENEQDGANLNYDELTFVNTTAGRGSRPGRMIVTIEDANRGGGNAWSGDGRHWIWTMSGELKDNTTFFQNADAVTQGTDPDSVGPSTFTGNVSGGKSTNASGGASSQLRWTFGSGGTIGSNRVDCGYFQYNITGANIPPGTYAVLARFAGEESGTDVLMTDMAVALGYVQGDVSYTPVSADDHFIPNDDTNWYTRQIGIITLPLMAESAQADNATLNLRIHCILDPAVSRAWGSADYLEWSLDSVELALIDENFVAIPDGEIGTDDRILIDGSGDPPLVYKVNHSGVDDAIQKVLAMSSGSAAFKFGPEDAKIFWRHDDDNDDPTTHQATLVVKHVGTSPGL